MPALRHPLVTAAAACALLIVLALPVLKIHTAQSGFDALPKSAPTVGTINRIQDAFSDGNIDPAIVAIEANTDSAATKQAIASLKTKALASGQMTEPIDVEIST